MSAGPTIETRRFLLAWLDQQGSISREELSPIRREVEDLVTHPREHVEIDVWLESPGGDAHAAYKLGLLLRAVAAKVRVVVPDCAKSAATLLTLVGDEIYMAPGADLGPLDAQMPDEGSVTGAISALNIARAADEVARDAVSMAVNGGAELLAITGLSRAQTLEAMLRFSSSFSEPLVRQLDPKVVHHAKQMLQVTAKYAEHLLDSTGNHGSKDIARALVETFPTHGYVIAAQDAHRLGLPILPLAAYEHIGAVRRLHRATEGNSFIKKFCLLDDFLTRFEPEPTQEPETALKRRRRGGGPRGRTSSSSRTVASNGASAEPGAARSR